MVLMVKSNRVYIQVLHPFPPCLRTSQPHHPETQGQSVPTPMNRIGTRAGEKISASDVNGDVLEGLRGPVPNGIPSDKALAFNEIQLALSNISSNLGKLVPVERQHVVPPAVAAFVHIVFLILIRQPIEHIISAVFFTLMLTSFAWPVWTTLKPMHHRLDEIDARMDVLQHSIESLKLAVSRLPSVNYVPDIYPVFSGGTVEEAPSQRETLEPNAQPIEPRKVPRVNQDEASCERRGTRTLQGFGHPGVPEG
ncbi:hypothetical protein BJY52DRAFT_774594 [Lactarius psammicola]|nr:hypothetical protein BJY52DRAFT_774594 [Lactarius psammicola]